MRQNALLLERKPLYRHRNGHILAAKWLKRKQSTMVPLTGSSSAVITEKNCESRSRWTAVTVRQHRTGQSLRAASTVKQYRRTRWELWNAASATSSGVSSRVADGYAVHATGLMETRQFARMLGLEPKNTAVRSPESNGIAESFVKTIKRVTTSVSCLNQTG